MRQMKMLVKIRLINLWLILLSLFEIIFGLGPYWIGGNWGGDYLLASFKLLYIFFLGIISLISGIFIIKKKNWAWKISMIVLIVVTTLVGSDYYLWLCHNGGIFSFLNIALGYKYDFTDVFYASLILISLLFTIPLLLTNRKNLVLLDPLKSGAHWGFFPSL